MREIIKYNIGDKIDDFQIMKIYTGENYIKRFIIKCEQCGRIKDLPASCLRLHKGTKHKSCGKGLRTLNRNFYNIWKNMRQRTTNHNVWAYKYYGKRGINSDEFKYFIDFYDLMFSSYQETRNKYPNEKISLDRIDNNKSYCKDNCRWILLKDQQGHTSRQKPFIAISPDGKMFYAENRRKFAKEHNLDDDYIGDCLFKRKKMYKNWKFEFV